MLPPDTSLPPGFDGLPSPPGEEVEAWSRSSLEVPLAPVPHALLLVLAPAVLGSDVLSHRLHGEHAVALLSTRRQTLELLGLLSEPLADRGSLSLNTRPRQTLG